MSPPDLGSRPPPSGREMIGRAIGNWRLVRLLGEGSFGGVFEAENTSIAGRRAAVKILHAHMSFNADIKRRFINEASAASRAEHENIIQVFDGGVTDDGVCYVVMEMLAGTTLTNVIARGRLDALRTINVGVQIASALQAAHAIGIIHRDLKPDNVYVVARVTNAEFVKVLDFGIAKLRSDAQGGSTPETGQQTRAGIWLGTPGYMSPEQWQTLPDIDGRSDVYALGIILYQCLTGELPFSGSSPFEWLTAHLHAPVPDASLKAPVPPPLAQAVARMMAKRREERPATMQAVLDELLAIRAMGLQPATGPVGMVGPGVAQPMATPSPYPTPVPAGTNPFAHTFPSGQIPAQPAPLPKMGSVSTPYPPAQTPFPSGATPYPPAQTPFPSGAATPTPFPVGQPTPTPFPPPAVTSTAGPARGGHGALWVVLAVVVLVAGGGLYGVVSLLGKARTVVEQPVGAGGGPVAAGDRTPARGEPTPAATDPALPPGMARVDGGTLHMGRDDYGPDDALDIPLHDVPVATFALAKNEVTMGEYQAFLSSDHGSTTPPWSKRFSPAMAQLPAIDVSHEDAEAYCLWKVPKVGRLPTEAEWEWAARGRDGRLYPWGDEFKKACVNALHGARGVLAPVDGEQHACGATPNGVRHLSGNVWEWTASPASLYPGSQVKSLPGEGYYVIRGGSFFNTERDELTTTFRQFANAPNQYLGFRCAATL